MNDYDGIKHALNTQPNGTPETPQTVKAKCTLCQQVVDVGKDALKSRPAPAYLPGVTEFGVTCPACGGWNHSAFIDAKLLRLRNNVRTYTRPVERRHAERYFQRKYDAFQRDCLARMVLSAPVASAPTPEQAQIFQAGFAHLEREA